MKKEIFKKAALTLGTPCYVFDTDVFAKRAAAVKKAFGDRVGLCYSIKANPFLLAALPEEFSYIEVCSPGELSKISNALMLTVLLYLQPKADCTQSLLTNVR